MSTTPAETTPAPAADRPKAERAFFPFNGQMALHESLLIFRAAPALQEFAQSFESLGQQFQRLRMIAQRRDQALTTGEKDALSKVLEQEVRDFDGKDALFQKVYGFRAGALFGQNRPFYVHRTFRLLTPVTDEEAAKMKAEKDFKPENLVTVDGKTQLLLSTLGGLAYDDFLRNAQVISGRRDNLVKFRDNLPNLSAEERPKAEAALKEAEESLGKDNEAMLKTFGFTLTRNITLDFVEAKFFVALVQEDLQKGAGAAPAEAAKAPDGKKEKAAPKAN